MPANLDVIWSANLSAVSTTVSAGTALTKAADGSFVPATAANLVGSSVPAGIARGDGNANQSVQIQQSGTVENEITGLGAGVKSPVIVDPVTARLVRKTTPVSGDTQIGVANERGDVTLSLAGSTSFTPAGDLSGSGVSQNVQGLQGRPISATAPSTNNVLSWNGSAWVPAAASAGVSWASDLAGSSNTAQTVVGLQGRPVANTAPSNGNVPTWNGSAYAPATPAVIPNNFISNFAGVADGATDQHTNLLTAAASIGAEGRLYLQPATLDYYVGSDTVLNCALYPYAGAHIFVAAGKTLTVKGGFSADQYQKVFTGPGQVILLGATALSPCWWGADPTGVADSAPAGQLAINSGGAALRQYSISSGFASIIIPVNVVWPSGSYNILTPMVLSTGNMGFFGSGIGATLFSSPYPCDVLFCTLATGTISSKPALVPGGPGVSYDMDFVGTGGVVTVPTQNWLTPSHNCPALLGKSLASMTNFAIRFFYKVVGTPGGGGGNIINISHSLRGNADAENTLVIFIDSTNNINIDFRTTGLRWTQQHPTSLNIGDVYYIELDWSQSTGVGRLHVGNVTASTATVSISSTGLTGNLYTKLYSITCIGARQQFFPEMSSGTLKGFGQMYNLEFASAVFTSTATTSRTTPTTHIAFGPSTLYGTDFETVGPGNEIVKGTQGNVANVFHPLRNGISTPYAFLGGCQIGNFRTSGMSLYVQLVVSLNIENISGGTCTYGLWLNNNCYSTRVQNVSWGTTSLFSVCCSGAVGVTNITDCLSLKSDGIALLLADGGGTCVNVYAQSSFIGVYLKGSGGPSIWDLSAIATTDEGYTSHYASFLVVGSVNAILTGCTAECADRYDMNGALQTPTIYNSGTSYVTGNVVRLSRTDGHLYQATASTTGNAPPNTLYWREVIHDVFQVSGDMPSAPSMTVEGCSLNGGMYVPTLFRMWSDSPRPGGVVVTNSPQFYGQSGPVPPFTNNAYGAVQMGVTGGSSGYRGSSSTGLLPQNYRGTVTFSNTSTTATVQFPVPTNYSPGRIQSGQATTTAVLSTGAAGLMPPGTIVRLSSTYLLSGLRTGFAYVVSADPISGNTQFAATDGGAATPLTTLIPGAAAFDFVMFMQSEPDPNYTVQLTPHSSTGTPAAGSNRQTYPTTTRMDGFDVTIETAPGAGNTVTHWWELKR